MRILFATLALAVWIMVAAIAPVLTMTVLPVAVALSMYVLVAPARHLVLARASDLLYSSSNAAALNRADIYGRSSQEVVGRIFRPPSPTPAPLYCMI